MVERFKHWTRDRCKLLLAIVSFAFQLSSSPLQFWIKFIFFGFFSTPPPPPLFVKQINFHMEHAARAGRPRVSLRFCVLLIITNYPHELDALDLSLLSSWSETESLTDAAKLENCKYLGAKKAEAPPEQVCALRFLVVNLISSCWSGPIHTKGRQVTWGWKYFCCFLEKEKMLSHQSVLFFLIDSKHLHVDFRFQFLKNKKIKTPLFSYSERLNNSIKYLTE